VLGGQGRREAHEAECGFGGAEPATAGAGKVEHIFLLCRYSIKSCDEGGPRAHPGEEVGGSVKGYAPVF
jgi:hypothetical protein